MNPSTKRILFSAIAIIGLLAACDITFSNASKDKRGVIEAGHI